MRRSAYIVGLLAALQCAGACDHLDNSKARHLSAEEAERRERKREAWLAKRRAVVDSFHAWQTRMLEPDALDLPAVGLPALDAQAKADAFHPVTSDLSYCDRLPPQETPTPEALAEQFQRHGAAYGEALRPRSFEEYRTHVVTERHLARLACLAAAAGPAHKQALLGLLEHSNIWIRYMAALHAINHRMDKDAARQVLDALKEMRAPGEWWAEFELGEVYPSTAAYQALGALERGEHPIPVRFHPNHDQDQAAEELRSTVTRARRPKVGKRRSVRR